MRETQAQFVERELRTHGRITRNQCLRKFITRLSSIICTMQTKGYHIETDKHKTINRLGKGYDYVYIVKHKPSKPVYLGKEDD